MTPAEERAKRALIQRIWRWRQRPLLLKRLPGKKMQWVMKRFDKEVLAALTDQDIRQVVEKMARMNKWI